VEIEIDDEHRRRESPLPQLADGDRHVVPQAEALAVVGISVVETAAQVDGDPARQGEPGGEDRPPHHKALGFEDAVGERVGEVEADDPEERSRLKEGVDVILGVDPPELAVGGGFRGVQVARRGQPQVAQEGEDALAAEGVGGRTGELDLIAPAVDQLDSDPPETGEPAPQEVEAAIADAYRWGSNGSPG
jgi:hypothetical protein